MGLEQGMQETQLEGEPGDGRNSLFPPCCRVVLFRNGCSKDLSYRDQVPHGVHKSEATGGPADPLYAVHSSRTRLNAFSPPEVM